ncbi:MAG: hypothetical protein GFH27_549309n158 [Chloroflexi bacterium AL-W]|nr:hypothetical protein [Chloroflexi bacterium AL-N1]NOK69860.1 hypothetical protein [Chloroflexi bacterium AL-N10]NOK73536.1 hypothetical protein [Chloroflexi bacterium AL-N5]NOK84030.1 hypothetical protein [Chloroflexi bacterium AL-W]NOK87867.1 hypothetical protein [Chloroflexi bacterium AL-N15]
MRQIDTAMLQTPVNGLNLQPGPLHEQLGTTPALVVFLRHFG